MTLFGMPIAIKIPSILPPSPPPTSWMPDCGGSRFSKMFLATFSPGALSSSSLEEGGGHQSAARPAKTCNPSSESWAHLGPAFVQTDLPRTPLRGGGLIGCQNHLNRLLWTRSSLWVSEATPPLPPFFLSL